MFPAFPAISAETGAADIPEPLHFSVKCARSRRRRFPGLDFPVGRRFPFPDDRFAADRGQRTLPTRFLVRMKIHQTNAPPYGLLHADSPSAVSKYPREVSQQLLARSCSELDQRSPISFPAGSLTSSSLFEFCPLQTFSALRPEPADRELPR